MKAAGRRRKGHDFERLVARQVRSAGKGAVEVRRGHQAWGALEPDVVIEGIHPLAGLWLECQASLNPTPLQKLSQAEADVAATSSTRLPVAVWRKTHERTINATMRMDTLLAILGLRDKQTTATAAATATAVTLDWSELLTLICRRGGQQ